MGTPEIEVIKLTATLYHFHDNTYWHNVHCGKTHCIEIRSGIDMSQVFVCTACVPIH